VYLSDVLGRTVIDAQGQPIGRLQDLIARVGGFAPPALVGPLVGRRREERFVPLAAVERLDVPTLALVPRADPARLTPFARRPHEVLLGRDIMDSQVIDLWLRGKIVARSNP